MGNVVVAVDVDHVELVVRRVDGQFVAELANAFVVQHITVAPQHDRFTAGQRSGDFRTKLRCGWASMLNAQADKEIEGCSTRSILRFERALESTATLIVERLLKSSTDSSDP